MVGQALTKNYGTVEQDVSEILRYAGVKKASQQDIELIDSCLLETKDLFRYSVCYAEFPISIKGSEVDFTFAKATSKALAKNLKGCDRAIVFCATIGLGIDRLIAKYGVTAPSKALTFQAIGAERIESLCKLFNHEMGEKYANLKPRFSPGYGDLDLAFQLDIFRVLDCSKKIGVNLTSEFLMTPSKSVTAIIGISNKKCDKDSFGCNNCNQTNCEFRR